MHVTAVVVNWNGARHLPVCLDALLAQDHDSFDVLVVDNASSDGSRRILRSYEDRHRDGAPPMRVRWNPTNRGFAGAVNDALDETDAAAILTANFDVRPRPDYVRRAVRALAAEPRRGAVQGKLVRSRRGPGGRPVIDTTGHVAFRTRLFRNRGEGEVDAGQWDSPGPVFGVSGALALYRRAMLDDIAIPRDVGRDAIPRDVGRDAIPRDVGRDALRRDAGARGAREEVFDEDLFAFWEDVDVDWRAAMRGWEAWYEPAAVAAHERGGAGPRRTRHVEELNFRNRLLTLVKCDDPLSFARDLPGIGVTTGLKSAELLLTVPSAFVASLGAVRLLPAMRTKRRWIQGHATVPSREVVRRWFEPFDYGDWVRTWWRRVRA